MSHQGFIIEKIRADLLGPAGGPTELISGRPTNRYLAGVLFPPEYDVGVSGEDDDGDGPLASRDEPVDQGLARAYDMLPSSMGISFYLKGASQLDCRMTGARYRQMTADELEALDQDKPETPRRQGEFWLRMPIEDLVRAKFSCPAEGSGHKQHFKVMGGLARLTAVFRPRDDGHLVTVSLSNQQSADSENRSASRAQIEASLFQCGFSVEVEDGEIGEYPTVDRFSQHPEDEELALIYRSRKTRGIGHGCAAEWDDLPAGEAIRMIRAEAMPSFEVRPMTTKVQMTGVAEKALSLQWLAHPDTEVDDLRAGLLQFVDEYDGWIETQDSLAARIAPDEAAGGPASRILNRQKVAAQRMRKGVETLFAGGADSHILQAFRASQEAMLRQFMWANRRGDPVDLGQGQTARIEPWADLSDEGPSWRPFQLAYLLLVLESLAHDQSPDREIVDLLWFPTGGGKTEAYLALAAFEIFHRRLRDSKRGAGTAVLMRYTLRLLTAQQFERAATLVSVLEVMRKADSRFGDEPIRLGLWVGGDTTPNELDSGKGQDGAVQLAEKCLNEKQPENPFLLRACPHCGTRIVPREKGPLESYGFDVKPTHFRLFCPDADCLLHSEIPVSIVDDDLYANPPTFLIGTIDKFARLVRVPKAGCFLGRRNPRGSFLPPSLVIQDELHLITGPLGTIAGLYEAGIETLLSENGTTPKYLAATATIQRAAEQAKALYGREAGVFPPSGLTVEDSHYSKEDVSKPGRVYVGAMGNGMYSGLTTLVQASAAVAHAASLIDPADTLARDTYWTQVIYHNSRQELGKTTTMLRDDVDARLEILGAEGESPRSFGQVEELSANIKGSLLGEALEHLETQWPNESCVDAVACTNMISVGVDISRLGLMIMKGQPKNTAEYIQASSRVGRDGARPAGVVLVLYSAMRPRDRSHYETFQAYHQALYRAVEPGSVTPFSPSAMDRALHASLVLLLRHALDWKDPHDAKKFDPDDPAVAALIDQLGTRLDKSTRTDERDYVRERLAEAVSVWADEVGKSGPQLSFNSGKQFRALLTDFPGDDESPKGVWPTLNSMRHVDGETPYQVRGQEASK